MKQPSLFAEPAGDPRLELGPTGQHTLPEMETLTDKMAAYFRRHPGEWIDILPLAQVGGMGGWRTEVSRCRSMFSMVIEQRMQHWPDGRNRSQYRYQP